MGMFDDVRVNYKLPGNYHKTVRGFQSKDFDCLLDLYIIEEDGKLWKKHNFMDCEEEMPERFSHNGEFRFYGYNGAGTDVWVECIVKFEDGIIIPESIRLFVNDEEITL